MIELGFARWENPEHYIKMKRVVILTKEKGIFH